MKKLLLIPLAAIILAGCSDSMEQGYNENLQGDFWFETVKTPDGRNMQCVFWKKGTGQSKYGGISCDWGNAR